jgi:hypothetical protein
MINHASSQVIDTIAKPSRKRRWQIALAIGVGLLLLLVFGSGSHLDLKLTRRDFSTRGDGKQLNILNTGQKLIEITGIKINDRDDCQVGTINLQKQDLSFAPITLNVGDQAVVFSGCSVIRATVTTKSGSASYSFN